MKAILGALCLWFSEPAAQIPLAAFLLGCVSAVGAQSKELTNSIGMKLVRIEPGSFRMGQDGPPADYQMNKHPAKFDDADWDERPAHKVTISSVQRAVLMRLREGPLLLCSYTDQWRDWKNRKGLTFKSASGAEFVPAERDRGEGEAPAEPRFRPQNGSAGASPSHDGPFRKSEFTGYGLFAAVSFDEGKTWPLRKLITPGGPARTEAGIDRVQFTLSADMAEPCGYLAVCQTRDGRVQIITSKNHYVFNLAWLKQPLAP